MHEGQVGVPRRVSDAFEETVFSAISNVLDCSDSVFYIALITLFCGFIGATIVNSSVDVALGYATTETGPWWRQRCQCR